MHIDTSHGSAPSAFVSRASGTGQHPARRCTHCNKLGNSVDFCWDIHPEKRLVRGRPPSSRRSPSVPDSSQSNSTSGTKSKLSSDQLKELQAYISRLSTTPEEASTYEGAQLAQALVASNDQDIQNYKLSHRTWRIRSTWTQSSSDAVEVPASSSALSEILPPPATSPRSAAAVPRSAAGSGCAAVRFSFFGAAVSFLAVQCFRHRGWLLVLRGRLSSFAAASFLPPSPLVLRCCRRLLLSVPPVAECLFVMAEQMGPKNNVVLDAGSTSKTENVPIQVTSIRLTKDNYLSWSATLEIDITSRGRLSYITGDKPAPSKSDPQWATWALEDSHVKVWIISSVSSDIQPLILRKPTSFDMWTVLAKMYGHKKRHLRTYQIKRSIYSLKQGDLSVAAFYAALKTKWEELDYHVNDEWKCGSDHSLYWEKEWMDRTFLFLGGLRDEFELIRSQILNGDEIPGIEEVYARDHLFGQAFRVA
ncbi:hypothetical protein EJ110_NYTH45839 [Nymphaea thermarum]|nr:hypothetical protein EJ110_NYTH45839 [Nymphaea thermarum]